MNRRRRCKKCGADVGSPDFDFCGACCTPSVWYVLTNGTLYWGLRWETYNSTQRRPRHGLGMLNDDQAFKPRLCYGTQEAYWEQRRAREVCGFDVSIQAVQFSGEYEEARILVSKGD